MKRTQAVAGFTLIELLIAIAIVAILIAIAIPNLVATQRRAYDNASMSCANALARAVRIYRIDHPTSSEVPGVDELYGNAEKDEFYGTNTCSEVAAKSGSVVSGSAAPDGQYEFTVKHAEGRTTYLLTPRGIETQP